MPLPFTPQVFAILAPIIEEYSGLHYDAGSRDLLADRLSERAIDLGLESLLDYYYFLRYDAGGPAELRTLVEHLTVHETYFFRETDPLMVLVHSIVPDVLRTQQHVRIWSAACATGGEPYTLAMMLSDAGLLDRAEIVASDLSDRALSKAREGVYSGRSLRNAKAVKQVCTLFEETPRGMRVRDFIRAKIAWHQVNLLDVDAIGGLGTFDVILCRNVLIYFSEDTVSRVAAHLGSALAPRGYLVVGASESLLRFGTMFACEEHGGSFFYRRLAR
jgi:chemotaxis protein methyltransferase CheR